MINVNNLLGYLHLSQCNINNYRNMYIESVADTFIYNVTIISLMRVIRLYTFKAHVYSFRHFQTTMNNVNVVDTFSLEKINKQN